MLLAAAPSQSATFSVPFNVNVEKVVSGTQPSGARYTVSVSCPGAPPLSGSANFTGPGTQNNVIMSSAGFTARTCTVTESPNGGATSVTIECFEAAAPTTNLCTNGVFNHPGGVTSTTYTVKVTNTFVPPTVPDPPTNVTAMVGSVILSWTPPANPGSSPITSYIVTTSPGGATYTAPGTATGLTILDLGPGTYTFTVRAVNAVGASIESAPSNPVTVTSPAVPVAARPMFTG